MRISASISPCSKSGGMTMVDEAYVFLDANILLHFQPPDQIDWPRLCGARR
jgi:hypothetical protein